MNTMEKQTVQTGPVMLDSFCAKTILERVVSWGCAPEPANVLIINTAIYLVYPCCYRFEGLQYTLTGVVQGWSRRGISRNSSSFSTFSRTPSRSPVRS